MGLPYNFVKRGRTHAGRERSDRRQTRLSLWSEEVVLHQPERALTMRITETNLPFQHADIRFELEPAGEQSRVTVSPVYRLRFGVLGAALDASYVKRTYARGMESLLAGLKEYVEAEGSAA